jgi:hypothetical protein
MSQLALARELGQHLAGLATDKAERQTPNFRERAEAAILFKLSLGPASGEDCTEFVRSCGIEFADGRALGSVYSGLRRRGLIQVAGHCSRRHGHGTVGLVWRLA